MARPSRSPTRRFPWVSRASPAAVSPPLENSLIRLDGRMKYVAGSVTLDGNSLPIWDDDGMNEFRFRDVTVIPSTR